MKYISPPALNQVRRHLAVLDMLDLQAQSVRSAMMALIAKDTGINIEQEDWTLDLDHGCVMEASDASPE